jgi:hypothetical protein
MDNKKAKFLPFHAINDFMRPDYRLEVVRSSLNAMPELPEALRAPLDRLTRDLVHVPGFRNSAKAPIPIRVKPTCEAFEKSPLLVASLLSVWAAVHPELRQQIYDLLKSRNWEILPADADRTKLPGFLTKWPKGESFSEINEAYSQAYPDQHSTQDDVSLMVVWISGRLPYEEEEDRKDES